MYLLPSNIYFSLISNGLLVAAIYLMRDKHQKLEPAGETFVSSRLKVIHGRWEGGGLFRMRHSTACCFLRAQRSILCL